MDCTEKSKKMQSLSYMLTEPRFALNMKPNFWGWLLLCFLWQPSLFLSPSFPVAFQFRLPGHPTPGEQGCLAQTCALPRPSNQSQRSSGKPRGHSSGISCKQGQCGSSTKQLWLIQFTSLFGHHAHQLPSITDVKTHPGRRALFGGGWGCVSLK